MKQLKQFHSSLERTSTMPQTKSMNTSTSSNITKKKNSYSTLADTIFPFKSSERLQIDKNQPYQNIHSTNQYTCNTSSHTRRSSIIGSIKFKPNINISNHQPNSIQKDKNSIALQCRPPSCNVSPAKASSKVSHSLQGSPTSNPKRFEQDHKQQKHQNDTLISLGGAFSQLIKSHTNSPNSTLSKRQHQHQLLLNKPYSQINQSKAIFQSFDFKYNPISATFTEKNRRLTTEETTSTCSQINNSSATSSTNHLKNLSQTNSQIAKFKCSLSSLMSCNTGASSSEFERATIPSQERITNYCELSFTADSNPKQKKDSFQTQSQKYSKPHHKKSFSMVKLGSNFLESVQSCQQINRNLEKDRGSQVEFSNKHHLLQNNKTPSDCLLQVIENLKNRNQNENSLFTDIQSIFQKLFIKKNENPSSTKWIQQQTNLSNGKRDLKENSETKSCDLSSQKIGLEQLLNLQQFVNEKLFEQLNQEKQARLETEQRISRMFIDKEYMIQQMENQLLESESLRSEEQTTHLIGEFSFR